MSTIQFHVVDAFTSAPFKGNPAAVVILPTRGTLPDSTLQNIAAEFNLSETAFLIPKPSLAEKPTSLRFGLRWFTPTVEVPLCGHATLASSRVIFAQREASNADEIEFETLSGVLVARRVAGSGKIELEFPAVFGTPVSQDEIAKVAEVLAEAAGGSVTVQAVLNAGFFMLVHIDATFDLESAIINATPFLKLTTAKGIIVTSNRPTALAPEANFVSRMFGPAAGVPEDPVCGSAHCILAPYWSNILGITTGEALITRQVSPRGGDLVVAWNREKSTVSIAGDAIVVSRGEMYL